MMNNSCIVTTTFCRKCKKLRSCLETKGISEYRFLCKECASEQELVGNCRICGREGIEKELKKHGGYCHLCIKDNIVECELCGKEVYSHNILDGACHRCRNGKNKACDKCGVYLPVDHISSDGLCSKCSIKIHKTLRQSNVNEVVECVECGREALVNDLNDKGLCIYCYSSGLEKEIKKLKKRKKAYY